MSIARYMEIMTAILGAANEADTAEPAVMSGNTEAAPAQPAAAAAGSRANGDAACSRCMDHVLDTDNKPSQGSQQVPKRMRRDCVLCLEADLVQHASYYYDVDNFVNQFDVTRRC
jgi:alkylhydroperoxidase family enzyme